MRVGVSGAGKSLCGNTLKSTFSPTPYMWRLVHGFSGASHTGVSSSLIDVAAHSFVDAAPVSASVTVAVTVISSAAVLAVAPSYTIAYETCVSAGTATEASGRSGPEIRLNLPMFALVTESVPPFGPPLATMLRRVRVEFLPTHRPGSSSYASYVALRVR